MKNFRIPPASTFSADHLKILHEYISSKSYMNISPQICLKVLHLKVFSYDQEVLKLLCYNVVAKEANGQRHFLLLLHYYKKKLH